jgi:hypothetical protein
MTAVFPPYLVAWSLIAIAWIVDKEFFFFLSLYGSFSLALASILFCLQLLVSIFL